MQSPRDSADDLQSQFPRTCRVIEQGITEGLHRGCQIYVSRQGAVLASSGIGEAATGQPMTVETVNLWRSTGKPMTAAAILRAVEDGLLSIDDHVTRQIPEFADDSVRVRELLTHTSGLPNVDVGWPDASWDEVLERLKGLRRDEHSAAAYSYFVTWFLLGEILLRTYGAEDFRDFIQQFVFDPLGMVDSWNGMTPSDWDSIRDRIAVVETVTLSGRRLVEPLHQLECCLPASPGANLRSTARDVGRFFEGLAFGNFFRSSETLELMTKPHREGVQDATFRAPVRMGLGVILDASMESVPVPYGFGRHCSARTWGHGGAQCAMAFADPQFDLVVAWVVNGLPGEPRHQLRNSAMNSAIYEDLGLVSD